MWYICEILFIGDSYVLGNPLEPVAPIATEVPVFVSMFFRAVPNHYMIFCTSCLDCIPKCCRYQKHSNWSNNQFTEKHNSNDKVRANITEWYYGRWLYRTKNNGKNRYQPSAFSLLHCLDADSSFNMAGKIIS